jgi:DNA-binding XRE family transcriptional regulator
MITQTEMNIIEQYVDEQYFDREKLLKYLKMHSIVGNEIFSYCDKRKSRDGTASYTNWLDDEYGYSPLPIKDFIRRVPFYFYVNNHSKHRVGNLGHLISGLDNWKGETSSISLDTLYQALEYMFYEKRISLEDIFCYITDQTGYVSQTETFLQWNHYLHLCTELDWYDLLPNCFISSYNEALEKGGYSPIIYEIQEIGIGDVYFRTGTQMEFEGTFPYDRDGNPVMKWIGLDVKNPGQIRCSQEQSRRGRLFIELKPNTIIHALNCYNYENDDDIWCQIYAGPQTMEFNHEILKTNRKRLKYTQQQVADAIGATVRTYQKWENNETTPDGHYLLRLMNWLDIRDVQDVVQYRE